MIYQVKIRFSSKKQSIGELELITELDFTVDGTFMTKRIGMCQYEFKGGMYLIGGESSLLGNRWYQVDGLAEKKLKLYNLYLYLRTIRLLLC